MLLHYYVIVRILYIVNEIPFFPQVNQEDALLLSKLLEVFLAAFWIKIADHLTHIPLADTHVPQRGPGNGGQTVGKL